MTEGSSVARPAPCKAGQCSASRRSISASLPGLTLYVQMLSSGLLDILQLLANMLTKSRLAKLLNISAPPAAGLERSSLLLGRGGSARAHDAARSTGDGQSGAKRAVRGQLHDGGLGPVGRGIADIHVAINGIVRSLDAEGLPGHLFRRGRADLPAPPAVRGLAAV